MLAATRAGALRPAVNMWAVVTRSARAMASTPIGQNLKIDINGDVALVRMDAADARVNSLTRGMMTDFGKALDALQANEQVKSVVLISAKQDGFIAGADINMLAAAKDEKELEELSRGGQAIMDRLAAFPKPVVAAIHGNCLGGGLEVALACHYRVASSSPKTTLALPEVKLGLLPGAGGTQRLPKIIGLTKALDMMLTGKNVRADRARSMKLVDVVADPTALETAAVLVAKQLASGKLVRPERKRSLVDRVLEDWSYARDYVFRQARATVDKQTGGHYPAPYAILSVVKEGFEKGLSAGLKKEAHEFARLGRTSQSKSLVSIFFAQTALKKNRPTVTHPSFGKPTNQYNTLAVIGAGLMGAGVAQVSIERDFRVILKDRDSKSLSRGEQQIYNNMNSKVKKRSLTTFERDSTMSRLIGITDSDAFGPTHLAKADMIIEAVFEDLAVKHKVIAGLQDIVPEHCVIASNTSALPITDIARGAKRPQNVVGMHYFSPVDKMPLLEVITTAQTSKEASAAAVDVGIRQGKTVIVVKDGPGFYTTRILSPFMVEAGGLFQEGASITDLDRAIKRFGFPVGPATLFDEVGIDVGNHIQPTLIKAFGARMGGANTEMMEEMVKKGMLGRKSGRGFFLYDGSSKNKEVNPDAEELVKKYRVPAKGDHDVKTLQNRVVLRMVNEAVFCLQDGTLHNALDGDIGAVFGLGFPPFLGGPFRYIDAVGATTIVDTLHRLRDVHGERFTPAPLLVDHAKAGKKFHPQ